MDISLISISHKNAPLEVRARFAFPVEAQEELMRQVLARNVAEERVFISTCNRTEIYTYHACPGSNFIKMQALLFEFAGIQVEEEMATMSVCIREAKPLSICSMWQQDWIPW